jgi:hypothetical protein
MKSHNGWSSHCQSLEAEKQEKVQVGDGYLPLHISKEGHFQQIYNINIV